MRSRLKLSKARARISIARRACASSWMRPSAFRCASSKLWMPIDSRFTPAARIARELSRFERAGIRFERDLGVDRERHARAHRAEQALDGRRREQARRAAAEEDRVDAAAPHQRQRLVEVGDQRVDVRGFGQRRRRASCELKSQYGHLRTHHGMWMYSDSGGSAVKCGARRGRPAADALRGGGDVASPRHCGRRCFSRATQRRRSACPRWLNRFFSSGSSSAAVRPSAGR